VILVNRDRKTTTVTKRLKLKKRIFRQEKDVGEREVKFIAHRTSRTVAFDHAKNVVCAWLARQDHSRNQIEVGS
jgi:hypothetical protein